MQFITRYYFTIITLVFFASNISAQQITMGFNMAEEKGSLVTTDPKFDDGRYYKNITFSMRAGESTMFYMIAATFQPAVFTVDTTLQQWVTGRTDQINFNYGSAVWITAKKDTTFHVVFSSVYNGTTGEFIYGYRTVTADQQNYSSAVTDCDRLNYVINNWQLFNGFFPSADNAYTQVRTTQNTWKRGTVATIYSLSNYKETIFTGDAVATPKQYTALLSEINACLNAEQWESKEESYTDPNSGVVYTTTYFTVKGATAGQAFNSFGLSLVYDPLGNDLIYIEFY